MKFQRIDVIDSLSSGTSDEGQMNIIDLISSKNVKYAEIINRKIERVISRYKSKDLKEVDKRIISGKIKNIIYLGLVKKGFSDSEIDEGQDFNSDCNIDPEMLSEGKILLFLYIN